MEDTKQPYYFGQKGTILEGDYPGWTVEFVDNTTDTGGHYVLVYDPNPQATEGYDWWLEYEADIPGFIEESNWRIEWPEPDSAKI
jgi:hypothetical protein